MGTLIEYSYRVLLPSVPAEIPMNSIDNPAADLLDYSNGWSLRMTCQLFEDDEAPELLSGILPQEDLSAGPIC